jgi:flagellar biosynthesis protein FliQ
VASQLVTSRVVLSSIELVSSNSLGLIMAYVQNCTRIQCNVLSHEPDYILFLGGL